MRKILITTTLLAVGLSMAYPGKSALENVSENISQENDEEEETQLHLQENNVMDQLYDVMDDRLINRRRMKNKPIKRKYLGNLCRKLGTLCEKDPKQCKKKKWRAFKKNCKRTCGLCACVDLTGTWDCGITFTQIGCSGSDSKGSKFRVSGSVVTLTTSGGKIVTLQVNKEGNVLQSNTGRSCTKQSGCVNSRGDTFCEKRKGLGFCADKHADKMKTDCKKSCGFCGCVNSRGDTFCEKRKGLGFCADKHADKMKTDCKKSCGFCV